MVKGPQCSALKQAPFNYRKASQFGWVFSPLDFFTFLQKQDSVISFKWSSVFKEEKKKKSENFEIILRSSKGWKETVLRVYFYFHSSRLDVILLVTSVNT